MRNRQYLLMGLLVLAACGKTEVPPEGKPTKTEPPASVPAKAAPIRSASISGQMFIVTKGRDNIKLALVEVMAYPEADLLAHLKARHTASADDRTRLMAAFEAAKKEADAADVVYEQARGRSRQTSKKLDNAADDGSFDQALDASMKSSKAVIQAATVRAAKAAKQYEVRRQIDYYDEGPYYFEKLPAPAATGKTDADGRFTLSIPAGRYILAATTSRKVGDKSEVYYWLVNADAGASNPSVILSNDNQFDTRCKECVQPDKVP